MDMSLPPYACFVDRLRLPIAVMTKHTIIVTLSTLASIGTWELASHSAFGAGSSGGFEPDACMSPQATLR
jgi:hypothetical protein